MQPAARDPIYTRSTQRLRHAARDTRDATGSAIARRARRTTLGTAIANICINYYLRHPAADRPLIDYRTCALLVPCQVGGYPVSTAPCDTVAVRCIVCRHCAYVRRRVLARFASALWGLETVRSSRQLIGTVIGVLLNGIIPEWAITLPLFIMLALMTVQTTAKG
jgi:hypothetical protein